MNARFRYSTLYAIVFAIVLVSFTVYAVLDTFVIARAFRTAEERKDFQFTAASQTDSSFNSELFLQGTLIGSYDENGITITLREHHVCDTSVYVADIRLDSLSSLKTAFAENTYGANINRHTSKIAQENNAILAVNGDFYGAREIGYVLRNGVLYRDDGASQNEDLAILSDGSFRIIKERDVSAKELYNDGAWQVFSFGPALLIDGEVAVGTSEEVKESMKSNPRTAIAVFEPLHYAFIVSDGRTKKSAGLSLYEMADFLQSLGATVAYNLDGGGSSTMVFQGEVVNNPTTIGKVIEERRVSDIVYIG